MKLLPCKLRTLDLPNDNTIIVYDKNNETMVMMVINNDEGASVTWKGTIINQ